MSEIAFGSSPAHAFHESPAHARDDPVESTVAWAIATYCLADRLLWGWNPFNGQLLNVNSFSARDKYLKQRRLITSPDGETADQEFTMSRETGQITEGSLVTSPGWIGFNFGVEVFFETVDPTATHILLNARDSGNVIQYSIEMWNATPNAFGFAAIKCAAVLDMVNLDDYNPGDFIDAFYQYNAFLPDIGTPQIIVTPFAGDIGEFPYTGFHDLTQPMAYYNYSPDTFPAEYSPPLPDEDWFFDAGIGGMGFEASPDSVLMLKSKVLMHGDLCTTIRRRKYTEGGLGENFEEIIKCNPFALSEEAALEESRTVRFNPPCRQGYYWWFLDAWPKHFTEVDGEQVAIPDYPTACDLLAVSGGDPSCATNPT